MCVGKVMNCVLNRTLKEPSWLRNGVCLLLRILFQGSYDMIALFASTFAFAILLRTCNSSVGVSLSRRLNVNGWKDLISTTPDITFASVHVQFYNGSTNPYAPITLRSAWNTSIHDLSVHMHPCLTSSFYSKSVNLECGTAREQLHKVINMTNNNNMDFVRHVHNVVVMSQIPTAKPTTMPTQSPSSNKVMLQRIFVCFEDEVPNRFMSNEHGENVRFLLDLVDEASTLGIQVGVYTTRNDWLNTAADRVGQELLYRISNTTSAALNPFRTLPLWTPRFDSLNSMKFYAPFGDWPRVLVKQVSGSTTALHRIGSDRVEMNFMDDALSAEYGAGYVLEV